MVRACGRVGSGLMREKSVRATSTRRRMVEEFWKLVHRNVGLGEIRFVLSFPFLSFPFSTWLETREDDPRPEHTLLSSPPGPVRGSVVTRSIFISKSFHRGQLETWRGGSHGLNRMITRNRIRWTFFGANRFHRFYRVLENERRVDRIKFNPMIEKSSIFAIASPRYSRRRWFLIGDDVSITYLSFFFLWASKCVHFLKVQIEVCGYFLRKCCFFLKIIYYIVVILVVILIDAVCKM